MRSDLGSLFNIVILTNKNPDKGSYRDKYEILQFQSPFRVITMDNTRVESQKLPCLYCSDQNICSSISTPVISNYGCILDEIRYLKLQPFHHAISGHQTRSDCSAKLSTGAQKICGWVEELLCPRTNTIKDYTSTLDIA